jgi:Na+-driven multidrug efflux pump
LLINFYNITDETKDMARHLMRAIALIVVFQSTNSIMTKGVLRGGGDTKFLMVADILFLWILSIPIGYMAGLVWHLPAFWIYFCLKIDQVVKAVWCVFRLKSRKWIKVISAGEAEALE